VKRLLYIIPALFMAFAVTGCSKHIVRDAKVYQVELDQYDSWATKQAELLRGFMAESCTCDAAQKFETKECRDAADFVLTIEARAAWHKAMSLYNASLTEERPPKDPPEIPPSSSLCPERVPKAEPAPVTPPAAAPEGGE